MCPCPSATVKYSTKHGTDVQLENQYYNCQYDQARTYQHFALNQLTLCCMYNSSVFTCRNIMRVTLIVCTLCLYIFFVYPILKARDK